MSLGGDDGASVLVGPPGDASGPPVLVTDGPPGVPLVLAASGEVPRPPPGEGELVTVWGVGALLVELE
jgi:hypothetical protein